MLCVHNANNVNEKHEDRAQKKLMESRGAVFEQQSSIEDLKNNILNNNKVANSCKEQINASRNSKLQSSLKQNNEMNQNMRKRTISQESFHLSHDMLNDGTINSKYSKGKNANMPPPSCHGSTCTIKELTCIVDNLESKNKIQGIKALTNSINHLKLASINCRSLKDKIKEHMENDKSDNYLDKLGNDAILMRGRKRKCNANIAATEINKKTYNTISGCRHPKEDTMEVLDNNARFNELSNCELDFPNCTTNHHQTTIANHACLSIINDPNAALTSLSIACLKSLSKIIALISECTAATHACRITLLQFRIGFWNDNPSNFSKGAMELVKLAKIMLNSSQVCPIYSQLITSFDVHGCSCMQRKNKYKTRAPIGKTSIMFSDRHKLKSDSSNKCESCRGDDKFSVSTACEF